MSQVKKRKTRSFAIIAGTWRIGFGAGKLLHALPYLSYAMNSEHQNAEQTTAEVLAKEWGIIVLPGFSRQDIIEKLALKMATVIEQGPEAFFRLMYRLDIPEKKLVEAMHDKNAVMEIATLVYERQLQKARSREYYRNRKPGDEDLSW